MLIPRYSFTGLSVPPLGLAYIAAVLRQEGHEVVLIDAIGEGIEQHFPHRGDYILHGLSTNQILNRIPEDADFIGISLMFSHEFPVSRDLIEAIKHRFPRAILVAGGEHITALPEDSLNQCAGLDIAVLGEGEETIREVVASNCSDAELVGVPGIAWRDRCGQVRFSAPRKRVREIDKFPRPAWDLVPLENYWKYGMGLGVNRGRSMPILATRGCPYQCTFCSNPQMWTTLYFARKPKQVIVEMRDYMEQYGVTNFDFYDLTAVTKREWIVEFCRGILDSGLKCNYQLPNGTRSEVIDREVARLLFASGCRNITYAPESGSLETLQRVKKRVNLGRMLDSIRSCCKEGLNVKANIVVGFPGDTPRDLWLTYRFILRMAVTGLYDVAIQPFSAYPGSELFRQLRKEKKIRELTDNYFFTLADYSDMSKATSWSEHLSGKAILWFRTVGMLSFYVVSYLLRPWRFIKLVRNLLSDRQESRLERSLSDMFKRRRSLAPELGASSKLAIAAQATVRPPYI